MNLRLAMLACLLVAATASARTERLTPRPALLLTTGEFVVTYSDTAVALYSASGSLLRQFPVRYVQHIALTSDEKHLAVVSTDDDVAVYELATARKLWSTAPSAAEIGDVCFAQDGKSLVVANEAGQVEVFDTASGGLLATIGVAAGQVMIASAALSPDGKTGVCVEWGGKVHHFDVASAQATFTGIVGVQPIRYSADGSHIVLAHRDQNFVYRLQVIRTSDLSVRVAPDPFRDISCIKPLASGTFAVTGKYACVTFDPLTLKAPNLWRNPRWSYHYGQMDFDPAKMLGVATHHTLVTEVFDLKAGQPRLKVDNSGNRSSASSRFFRVFAIELGIVAAVLLLSGIVWVVIQLKRQKKLALWRELFDPTPDPP